MRRPGQSVTMKLVPKWDDVVNRERRAKFAREATMEAFNPYRYWSARDADGFEDIAPKGIEKLRYDALWRR